MKIRTQWLVLVLLVDVFMVGVGYGATFVDVTAAKGLTPVENPAAWIDFDNDGWTDLYAAGGLGGGLWKNNQGTGFALFGGSPAWSPYTVWGDVDNDGFPDMFASNGNALYLSIGGTSFQQDMTFPALPTTMSWGASWSDHDGDGDLDIYVSGFEDLVPEPDEEYPDVIVRDDNGTFGIEWTQSPIRRGRGVTSCDFDEDGDIDIYVSNYRLQPNLLWQNDGTGNFTDVAATYGVAGDIGGIYNYGHTIGSCWGDMDNDGHIDLFVGNFRHPWDDGSQDYAKFFKNQGPAEDYHFQLMEELDGADWQESYSTPTLGDYDNDGDLDLFYTIVNPGTEYARLYRNDGNWSFTNVTAAEGLSSIGSTYQAAWGDYDNDGDLDLMSAGRLYENQGNSNHWLKVKLEGDGQLVNRSAIGAQVRVDLGGSTLTRQVEAGTGQGNQNDMTLHFGLGSNPGPLTLEITWPNGDQEVLGGIAVDQLVEHTFASDSTIYLSDDFQDDTPGRLTGQATDTEQVWGTFTLWAGPTSFDVDTLYGLNYTLGAGKANDIAGNAYGNTVALGAALTSGIVIAEMDMQTQAPGYGGATYVAHQFWLRDSAGVSASLGLAGANDKIQFEGLGLPTQPLNSVGLGHVTGSLHIKMEIDLDSRTVSYSWYDNTNPTEPTTSGRVDVGTYAVAFAPETLDIYGYGQSGVIGCGFDNIRIYGPGCSYVQSQGLHIPGDLNNDCYVNARDFEILTQAWLQCNNPTDANCGH